MDVLVKSVTIIIMGVDNYWVVRSVIKKNLQIQIIYKSGSTRILKMSKPYEIRKSAVKTELVPYPDPLQPPLPDHPLFNKSTSIPSHSNNSNFSTQHHPFNYNVEARIKQLESQIADYQFESRANQIYNEQFTLLCRQIGEQQLDIHSVVQKVLKLLRNGQIRKQYRLQVSSQVQTLSRISLVQSYRVMSELSQYTATKFETMMCSIYGENKSNKQYIRKLIYEGISTSESKKNQLIKQNQRLEAKIVGLQQTNKIQRFEQGDQKLLQKNKYISQLADQYERMADICSSKDRQIRMLQQELEMKQSEIKKSEDEHQDELTQIKRLKHDIRDLKDQIYFMQTEQMTLKNQNHMKQQYKTKISELLAEIQQIKEKNYTQTQKILTKYDEQAFYIEELKATNEQSARENNNLQRQVWIYQEKIQEEEYQQNRKSGMIEKYERLIRENMEKSKSQEKQYFNEILGAKREQDDKMNKERQQLEKMRQSLNEVNEILSVKQRTISQQIHRIESLENKEKQLKLEIKEYERENYRLQEVEQAYISLQFSPSCNRSKLLSQQLQTSLVDEKQQKGLQLQVHKIERLEKKVKQTEQLRASQIQTMRALQLQYQHYQDNMNSAIKQKETDLQSIAIKFQQLSQRYKTILSTNQQQQKTVIRLQSYIDQEGPKYVNRVAHLEKQNSQLIQKYQDVQNKIQELQHKIAVEESHDARNQQYVEIIDNSQKERNKLELLVSEKQSENQQLMLDVQESKLRITELLEHESMLKQKINEDANATQVLSEEIERLHKENMRLQQSEKQIINRQLALKEQARIQLKEKEDIHTEILGLLRQRQQEQQQSNQYKQIIKRLEQDRQKLEREIGNYEAKINELTQAIHRVESIYEQEKVKFAHQLEKQEADKREIHRLHHEIGILQNEISQKRANAQIAEGRVRQIQYQNQQIKVQLSQETTKLTLQNYNMSKQLVEYQDLYRQLQRQNDQYKKNIPNNDIPQQPINHQSLAILQQQLARTQQLNTQYSQKINILEDNVADLTAKITSLQNAVSQSSVPSSEKNLSLKQTIQNQKQSIMQLTQEKQSLILKIQSFTQIIVKLEQKINNYSLQSNAQHTQPQPSEQLQDHERQIKDLSQKNMKIIFANRELQNQISGLKKRIRELQFQNNTLTETIKTMRTENASYILRNQEEHMIRRSLEKTIKQLNQEINAKELQYHQLIAKIQTHSLQQQSFRNHSEEQQKVFIDISKQKRIIRDSHIRQKSGEKQSSLTFLIQQHNQVHNSSYQQIQGRKDQYEKKENFLQGIRNQQISQNSAMMRNQPKQFDQRQKQEEISQKLSEDGSQIYSQARPGHRRRQDQQQSSSEQVKEQLDKLYLQTESPPDQSKSSQSDSIPKQRELINGELNMTDIPTVFSFQKSSPYSPRNLVTFHQINRNKQKAIKTSQHSMPKQRVYKYINNSQGHFKVNIRYGNHQYNEQFHKSSLEKREIRTVNQSPKYSSRPLFKEGVSSVINHSYQRTQGLRVESNRIEQKQIYRHKKIEVDGLSESNQSGISVHQGEYCGNICSDCCK